MVTKITLTVTDGKLAGESFTFGGRGQFVIGRGSDCDLCLPSDDEFMSVSRHHCLIDLDPPEVRVRDLGSRNGTRLDGLEIGWPADGLPVTAAPGKPAREYHLRDGDELQLGSVDFWVAVDVNADGDFQDTHSCHEVVEMGACI